MIAFTICANNYFARAKALAASFKEHYPEHENEFYIVIADEKKVNINYQLEYGKVQFLQDIEPEYKHLVDKYNTVELATSLKASAFQYYFNNTLHDEVLFFDPDIYIFSRLKEVDELFPKFNIVLTPHVLTPIPDDKKTPSEVPFNRVGIFNLGFLALKRSENTLYFISWWKSRLFEYCYIKVEEGLFTDQIFINHVPVFFENVAILKHYGYNMAPWNLHERYISKTDSNTKVNKIYDLRFYHFSTFTFNKIELPYKKYDRFRMSERADLYDLYKVYNDELIKHSEEEYENLEPYYQIKRMEELKNEFRNKRFRKRIFWHFLDKISHNTKLKIIYFLNKSIVDKEIIQ